MKRALVAVGASAMVVAAIAAARRRSGRLDRSLSMARMGTRAGIGYASTAARSAFADPQTRDVLRARFELETAEQVATELGNMKGAVMKLGQMASYVDQGLPEPVRDALAQLQSDAPPMSPQLVERTIETELGATTDEIFASFDPTPLAAASIGQVHRAVTRNGLDVAIKIQYPGVDSAITADLDNSEWLFTMMSMLFPGMDPGPIVEELRSRITEELDYDIEAGHQQRFADHYRGHPTIRVPDVHPELSTSRVLTTDFVDAARWSEMLEWIRSRRT